MHILIFRFFYLLLILTFWGSPFSLNEGKAAEQEVSEIDSEASPPLKYQEIPHFSWGAKLNFEGRTRNNRDLDNGDADHDLKTRGGLTLAGLLQPPAKTSDNHFEIFGEIRLQRSVLNKEGKGKVEDETEVDFKKGHLTWRNLRYPALRLQIGRQRFKDFREWIFDENLDAVRLFYVDAGMELQFAYGSNIFDPEDAEDKIKNLILYGVYDVWKKDKAAAYLINRRGDHSDNDPTDLKLTFIGVSWKGKSIKKQKYWLEAAIVRGNEEGKSVRGYGFDLGWTSRFKHRFKPALTVGYAFGSGDSNPDDHRDKSFRQTGLHDNSAKLRGVIKVEQYGELFEPELSNLIVGTLAFGIRPLKKASIDLVYHHFHQVWALQDRENELRDVGIKEDPNGESRDLGDELDLVLGWKISQDLKLEAIAAFFLPGSAFPDADNAFLGKIKVRYLL